MASIRQMIQCFLILIYAFSITCKSNSKSGNARKQIYNKSSRLLEEPTQRISANINETVVLGCNLEFPDNGQPVPYVIQWTKLNVKIPIFIWYDGYPPHTGENYQGRTTLNGQASLQLANVQESDQGWYECKVFFVNRPPELPKNGTWVHLDVHAPPHFKKRPPEVVYVKIGESVSLSCIARATPPPTTTWYKDGRPLEENPNLRIFPGASELQIVNIQQSDIGQYECSAKNREGSINATTKLIIAGPAVITQQPTNLTKLEGEKAELSCEAKALPSNITYKWFLNGKSISQISSLDSRALVRSNGMLQIHPVSSEDSGIFTCEVFNGIGVPEMQSAHLDVQFPARVRYSPIVQYLPLGLSGIVRCYVEANPPANQVAWTKDGLPFEPSSSNGVIILNNGSLLFQHVTIDNQGIWKCTPYNEYGTTVSGNQMEVLVKEPPVWTIKPNEVYQQQVNSELHVSCAGEGTPKPTISFRRADNGKLPKDRTVIHGGNFTLKTLRKEDYGTYECILSNEIATLVSTFTILVDLTTPHAPLNIQVNTSTQAATVTWNPSYDGGYDQTYTIWYRMADQGDSDWKSIRVYPEGSTTFTLYNLAANTYYEFQVFSRNILGEGLPSAVIRAKTKANQTNNQSSINHKSKLASILNGQLANNQNSNKNGKNHKQKTKLPSNLTTTNSKQTSPSTVLSSSVQQSSNTTGNQSSVNNKTLDSDENKVKPDPPRNVTIQRVSQGYAISWLKPLNSSVNISYYNVEYKEGKDGESKFWGPIKKETSYLAKLKPGETYRIRVFSHSSLGVGSPSQEIVIETHGAVPRDKRGKAIYAGIIGGLLFFATAILLSIFFVKQCNRRKRRKNEKAYMMVTCPIMDHARNGTHSHNGGSPIPLKQYAKSRISSLINKIINNGVFRAKQEQTLNQILKHHQDNKQQKITSQTDSRSRVASKTTTRTLNDQINRGDKSGFEEWSRRRNNENNQNNRSIHRNHQQPVPPIRKSKLLSAAIVNKNTSTSSQAKLIPNDSPVIATISSPNSTQTLQVRSHLVLHPSNDLIKKSSTAHQHQLPISPVPFKPTRVNQTPVINQQSQLNGLRQFRSAELPLKYGAENRTTYFQNLNLVNQNQFNYQNHPIHYQNQTFHQTFEPVSFSPINVLNHHSHNDRLLRNNQVFVRKTLPPSFLNRPPQYLLNLPNENNSQPLPNSSTFISSPPFDHNRHQMMNVRFSPSGNPNRLRSLSAPDKVNVSHFSPIHNTSFDHQSPSTLSYNNPSFRRHPLIESNNRFNFHNQRPQTTPTTPRNFYPEFTHSDSHSDSHVGSDLHRIETINRMRLAQLTKENNLSVRKRIHHRPLIIDDYLRPIDYLNYANNNLVTDDFEVDLEDENNSYLFHKSIDKPRNVNSGNKSGPLTNEEITTTSSGRGSSSNLDNSPKINLSNSNTMNGHKNELKQPTVVKSNSSSSGFASRTFSITGSPDKQSNTTIQAQTSVEDQTMINHDHHHNSLRIPSTKKKLTISSSTNNEVSEADENYEFDLETRLNALFRREASLRRSQSTCTTPLRFYDAEREKDPFSITFSMANQKQQLQNRSRRAQQFKHIDQTMINHDHLNLINTPPISDENFDDYYDIDTAADEEIRILNGRSSGNRRRAKNPNFISLHSRHGHHSNRLNSRKNRDSHLNLMEQPTNFTNSRAVFSDSELYDNQFNFSSNSREYMMTRYWRRIRCEQLKQELNEYRMKFNLDTPRNHQYPKTTTTDLLMIKNETAC